MSADTEVMFEIGVAEHPATKARLEALARAVLDAQAKMTQGIERVGLAAQTSSGNIGSITGQIKDFRDTAVESYDNVRDAISRVQSIASNRSQVVVDVAVKGASANRVGAMLDEAETRTKESGANIKAEMAQQTADMKEEYMERVLAASAAYAEMADDLDGYLAKEGSVQDKIAANMRKGTQVVTDAKDQQSEATERLNSSVVKGVRSVLGATKGFAELGLMSEENTQKMLQGLVAIQGAFDIVDGAVDLLESFSMGWKAVRQSTEAAANVTKAQQALMGPQFAQLRAYQAQLVLEAQTANAATLANNRLAMSRGTKGGVASSVIDLAAGNVGNRAAVTAGGAATSAASGAATAVVGAGQMSIGGVAVGVLGTIAAAGAALAALSLVAVEAKETLSGRAQAEKSVTMTIAKTQASWAAWAIEQLGLQNRLGKGGASSDGSVIAGVAISIRTMLSASAPALADYAMLAKGNVELAKAERNRAKTAIMAELNDKKSTGETVALIAGRMAGLDRDSSVQRNNASFNGSVSGVSMAESRTQTETATKLEAMQKIINQFRMGDNNDFSEYTRAVTEATTLQADIINSISRQGTAVADSFNDKLQAERTTQAAAYEAIEELTAIKAANIDVGKEGDKRREEAVRAIRTLEDGIVASKEKQRSLVEEQSRVALDTQSKIQDSVRSQIALQETSMDRLTSGYKNAAQNFAKLGAIEKERAIKALEFARANGAGALKDEQKDALRSVGTEEAMRFANEGDAAEAKKFGFNRTFGSKEASERASIEQTQKTLRAQLSASYNVSAKLDLDSNAVVKSIVDTVNPLLESKYQEIQEGVQRQLATFKQTTQQAARDQLTALKGQKGAARW